MPQYILKSVLVAEIEKRITAYINSLMTEQVHTLSDILDFINTLEVKEVDLEKENLPISNSLTKEGLFTFEDGSQAIITKTN